MYEDSLADETGFDTLNDLLKQVEGRIRFLKKSDSRIRLLKKAERIEKTSNGLGGNVRIL